MAIKLGERSEAGATASRISISEDLHKFYFYTVNEIQEELIKSKKFVMPRYNDTILKMIEHSRKWYDAETERLQKFDDAMKDAKRIAEENYEKKKHLDLGCYSVG